VQEDEVQSRGRLEHLSDRRKPLEILGKELKNVTGYMAGAAAGLDQPLASSGLWIDDLSYEKLLNNLASGSDPEVIEMAFAIGPGDEVEPLPWYHNPNGEVFPGSGAEYAIHVLDANGNLLETLPFTPATTMFAGAEEIQLTWKPVVLSLSYPAKTAVVSVVKAGSVLATFIPQTKLLKDAVLSLPDEAFITFPDQRRAALTDMLDAAETALRNEEWATGKGHINEFKSSAAEWLEPDYAVLNPLQVSRQGLDLLVTNSVQRVDAIAPPVIACDADGDADVDPIDLQAIRLANGLLAQPGDPRDGNQDGRINVADVRYCQLRQTAK
jgi:hypothetical protein